MIYPLLKNPIWSNLFRRTLSANSAAHSRSSLTMDRNSLARRWPHFFSKYGIKQPMSTPRYPQCNGQEEQSNKLVLDCLKNRLEDTKGKWVDELPRVLWAYRSTKQRSTSETPFFLIYRTEEIIPPHITIPSMSNEVGIIDQNYEQIKVNIDLLEEERERAIVKVAAYQQHLTSYYNKRAKVKQFQPRYLVLRKAFNTTQRQG